MKLAVAILISLSALCRAFPQGAPPESCESLSPERGHGPSVIANQYPPFSIIQHGSTFNPGDRINVEILQHDRNINFKGFMVQALDVQTNEYIGEFVPGAGMQVMKECAAVTHSDAKPKKAVHLIWQAPANRAGSVVFRGTIVVHKDTYFINVPGQLPPQLPEQPIQK